MFSVAIESCCNEFYLWVKVEKLLRETVLILSFALNLSCGCIPLGFLRFKENLQNWHFLEKKNKKHFTCCTSALRETFLLNFAEGLRLSSWKRIREEEEK